MKQPKRPATLALIATLAAVLAIGAAIAAPRGKGNAGAGPGGGYGMGQPRQGGPMWLGERLGLTDEQRERVRAIVSEHRTRVQEVMQSNLTPEQKAARRQELRQEMRSRIQEVLTPEQRQKAQQMWRDGAGRRHTFRHRAQAWLEKLDLTAEQKQKIASIRQTGREQVRAVRTDTKLTDTEKRDRIRAIRQQTHEQVLSVLTPEQREKFQQMCPKPGAGRQGAPAGMRRHGHGA